jgi:hypothetical protein
MIIGPSSVLRRFDGVLCLERQLRRSIEFAGVSFGRVAIA